MNCFAALAMTGLRLTVANQQETEKLEGNSMLTLHHLNDSRSQRILWLLEELGLPHEIKSYQRDATTRLAQTELAKIHPLGNSTDITDGETTVAETDTFIT